VFAPLHRSAAALAARASVFALIGACTAVPNARDGGAANGLEHVLTSAQLLAAAGRLPAPSSDGEIGVIRGARVSPNGHAVAVLDDVSPSVKVFDAGGSLTAAIHAPGDTADDYALPVVAIADDRVLILAPDSSSGGLFDLRGRRAGSLRDLDFTPLAATALSDSTWIVYGPSMEPHADGATWLHCLYVRGDTSFMWLSLLRDSLVTPLDSVDVPFLSVSNQVVYFSHRTAAGFAPYAAQCGSGEEQRSARVWRLDEDAFALERGDAPLDLGLTKATLEPPRRISSFARFFGAHAAPGQRLRWTDDRRHSEVLNVPGQFAIMDVRVGTGVLIATSEPVPEAFLVPEQRFASVLLRRQ